MASQSLIPSSNCSQDQVLFSELLWVLSPESCGCCFDHSLLFYLEKRINNVFYSDSLSGIIVLKAAAVLRCQDAEVSCHILPWTCYHR